MYLIFSVWLVLVFQLDCFVCDYNKDEINYNYDNYKAELEKGAKIETTGEIVVTGLCLLVYVLITIFTFGKRQFKIVFNVLVYDPKLFFQMFWDCICLRSDNVFARSLLNMSLLIVDLKIDRELSLKDIDKMVQMYDAYEDNFKKQGNEAVIEWLKFNQQLRQQRFMNLIAASYFYTDYELTHRLAKILRKLKIKRVESVIQSSKTPSSIDEVIEQMQSNKSKLDEKAKSKLETMTKIFETIKINNINTVNEDESSGTA